MLNMGAVLLLLIGFTDGVTTVCDATQPDITTQCFGSLGGTVEVQLPTKTSQDDTFRLKKNNVATLSEWHQTNMRYSFNVSTGIFTIKDIDRTDNGEYSMQVHNTTGKLVASTKCYLTIQAPVSSPLLSRECLSWGQQRVSCSAGGDGLHYSWSLDGLPLNDTRLPSGPSSASDVTLEPGRSGLLTCSVHNIMSNATANITLSVCDGQWVKVETEVLSYPGQTVNLRCSFNEASGIVLTQVTWIYEPVEGERVNIAVLHPVFGTHFPEVPQKGRVAFLTDSLTNPSIQISNVKMSDAGKYICKFAIYPSGEVLGTTSLIMLAPVSSPLLSRECLSRGQQRVSCSAGGDGLHYSWSLDGLPLNDTRLPPGPGNASDVTLEPGRSGLVTCSVRNNGSFM
ncbi:uncharacterized protein LOC130390245 isoform X2 [Gadus chalcogrammus]|uniref:uncharacterized protein LOC130390245 isoform X2 n=1 Tax=Gadus chalcogrammus TaxID=1042646 RepID=UPI0024C48B1F|nr:uncharacterized protein LOC130390245 isoform X2 [Gadus chalcogrammus]